MNLSIKPLTVDCVADYFDFFDNRAFRDNAEWSCCYCTWFHMNEASEREADAEAYVAVEGYPKRDETGDALNFTGPTRLYARAGFSEVARMDDRAVMRKEFEPRIETHIAEALAGDARTIAADFAAFLLSKHMLFERGQGYWADKRYWRVKFQDKDVCFILVNGYGALMHKDEPEGWIIWSDDGGETDWFANAPLDERAKEIAWKNVDFCGHCGGVCDGGTRKTIFGKAFENVCRTAFRFDNPNAEAAACAKRLVEIRKNDIDIGRLQ